MLDLFQITGSCSFAVRAALEEGGIAYTAHNVHPGRRDLPGFAETNPLRRVPAIRDGDVTVYETGACLLYLVERYPEANLGPQPGDAGRADLLRWTVYLANTVHDIHSPIQWPGLLADDEAAHAAIRAQGLARLADVGAHLEAELRGREWCLDDRFSVADIYLYMLKGWEAYGSPELGGPAVAAHYARVGARPGVARARALDDLDERLIRQHPELRGGEPTSPADVSRTHSAPPSGQTPCEKERAMPYTTEVTLLDLEGGGANPSAAGRLWMVWTEVGGPQSEFHQDEYDRVDVPGAGVTFTLAFPVRGPSISEAPHRDIGLSLQDAARVGQEEGWWFRSGRFISLPPSALEVVLAPATDVPAADLTSGLSFPMTAGSETITGVTLTPGTPAGQIGFTATGTTTRVPGSTFAFTYTSTLSVSPSSQMTDPQLHIIDVGIAPGSLTFTAGPGQGFVAAILNGVSGLIEARARPQLHAMLNSRVNAAAFDAVAGRLLPPPRLNPDGSVAAAPVWPASIIPSVRSVRVTSTGIQIRAALGAFGGVVAPLRAEFDRVNPADPNTSTSRPCPVGMLAVRGLVSAVHLQSIRRWRDETLASSPDGRLAAIRFRRHAGEVSRLLARDPRLALRAAEVARRAATAGIDARTVTAAERVLGVLGSRGSRALADDIAWALRARPWAQVGA